MLFGNAVPGRTLTENVRIVDLDLPQDSIASIRPLQGVRWTERVEIRVSKHVVLGENVVGHHREVELVFLHQKALTFVLEIRGGGWKSIRSYGRCIESTILSHIEFTV